MSALSVDRHKTGNLLTIITRLRPYLAPYKWQLVGALIALTLTASLVLGLGYGLRAVIDYGFSASNSHWLNISLLVMLATTAGLALATYSRFYLVSWLGERVIADLRERLFRHLLTLDISYFETTRTGEIVARLTTDTALLQSIIGSSASMALRNLLMLIGGMVMLFLTSAKLTLIVLATVPLVIVPILIYARRTRHLARASQDRVADIAAEVNETLSAIRTVQAFSNESLMEGQFNRRSQDAFGTARARIRSRASLTAAVIFLVFSAIGLILWLGGHDVMSGRITAGQLSAFIFYSVLVASAAAAISEVMAELERAAGATERIFELLETRPVSEDAATSDNAPLQGTINFNAVSFAYPSAPERLVLQEISLDIKPGERIAIVGPSGAGKSTLFQLLLRFYDPQAGRVTIDSKDLRHLSRNALRRQIGLVPQEPVLFSASAADNIRFGRPDATEAEIHAAAATANALTFIQQLPDGFATHLGEKGVRLSGGQRQRLALARAILRDPAILLLDEATSALDAESEQLVQQALEQVMPGRTTLIIAHRLATVLTADRIVVMEAGRIVATGTHAELVQAGGLYSRLAALQFKGG